MTWLPDHRADHTPEHECDGCRTPETPSVAEEPRSEYRVAPLRTDLVIQPGANRK